MTEEQIRRVCQTARSYLGVPWLGQGRSKQGVDCVGLVIMSYRGAGLTVDEGRVEYQKLDHARFMRVLLKHCRKFEDHEVPSPGDCVIYGLTRNGHIGMLVDRKGGGINLIHCEGPGHVVTESRFDLRVQRGPVKGYYRWRG